MVLENSKRARNLPQPFTLFSYLRLHFYLKERVLEVQYPFRVYNGPWPTGNYPRGEASLAEIDAKSVMC